MAKNSEQNLKIALAALDKAVQEWYQENNPDNTEHYASAVTYKNDRHVCRIILNSDAAGQEYEYIAIEEEK